MAMFGEPLSSKNVENLQVILEQNRGDIHKVVDTIDLILHPTFYLKVKDGIVSELESRLTEYIEKWDGLLMAYEDVRCADRKARVCETGALAVTVHGTFYVFMPKRGSIIEGVVVATNDDEQPCCNAYGLFNVVIVEGAQRNFRNHSEGEAIKLELVFVDFKAMNPLMQGIPFDDELDHPEGVADCDSGNEMLDSLDHYEGEGEAERVSPKISKKKIRATKGNETDDDEGISEPKKKKKQQKIPEQEEEWNGDYEWKGIEKHLLEEMVSLSVVTTSGARRTKQKQSIGDSETREEIESNSKRKRRERDSLAEGKPSKKQKKS